MCSACAISILRTMHSVDLAKGSDFSYDVAIMGLWSWAEVTSGVLISCFPVMLRFFQHFWPQVCIFFSSHTESHVKANSSFHLIAMGSLFRKTNRSFGGSNRGDDPCHELDARPKYIALGDVAGADTEKNMLSEVSSRPDEGDSP